MSATLAEHIEDGLVPPDGDVEDRTRFVVDGPKTADWALRKLARARAHQAEAEALAAAECSRIKDWLAAEVARHQHDVDFFTGLLTEYHRHVLAAEPDRKTIALPGGKLVARKQPARWEFDADAFVAWAVRAGRDELVRRPAPEVDKAAAKRALEPFVAGTAVVDPTTGEKAEGVRVEPGEVRYSVEAGE